MGKKLLITLLLLTGVLFLLPFAIVPMHPTLAGFLHRQLAYRVISDRVTEGCESDLDRTLAVMAFVHLNESQPDDWALAEDRHVLHDLVRHIGWCDQQANAMAHLLMPRNIDARMVMFPCHTFADVKVDGRPMLFDPLHNSYFFEKGMPGQIAALSDLLSSPQSLITRHGQDMEDYPEKEVLDCGRPMKWKPLSENLSPGKKALDRWIGFYHKGLGVGFSRVFNKWYLRYVPEQGGELYRARCLDLFGHHDEARAIYADLEGLQPAFFLFKSQLENGYPHAAMETLTGFITAETGRLNENDRAYLLVAQDYLRKVLRMEGTELMRLFRMDEEQLMEIIGLLEQPQIEQWLAVPDMADTFSVE